MPINGMCREAEERQAEERHVRELQALDAEVCTRI